MILEGRKTKKKEQITELSKSTELVLKRSTQKKTGEEIGGTDKVRAEMVALKKRDPVFLAIFCNIHIPS